LEQDIFNTITPEFANKMISRSIVNMTTIKENIVVFTRAATAVFKSRRIADQIGTMLAGTYLCHSTNVISYEDAKLWIERYDWEDHTIASVKTDPERLVERIATRRIIVTGTTSRERHDITIGECIVIAARVDMTNPLDGLHVDCGAELRRWGIKVLTNGVTIANSCAPMAQMLNGTPWESSWSRALSEIPGSEKTKYQHYTPGIKARGMFLPLSVFSEGEKNPAEAG
jgi:hypothetical protein